MLSKKEIRKKFRSETFRRDNFRCVICGLQATDNSVNDLLDAHHITPREEMPNGGYVKENGISLCDREEGCHYHAEMVLQNKLDDPKFLPENLYILIGSSKDLAIQKSHRLNQKGET